MANVMGCYLYSVANAVSCMKVQCLAGPDERNSKKRQNEVFARRGVASLAACRRVRRVIMRKRGGAVVVCVELRNGKSRTE
jgi:hypothetical protein